MTQRLFSHLPVQALHGIGPTVAERLKRLGLYSIRDLLLYFPFRYEDRTKITSINKICAGSKISVQGKIIKTELVKGRQTYLIAILGDGTGLLQLRFIHYHHGLQNRLRAGTLLQVYGDIKFNNSSPYMIHPQLLTTSVVSTQATTLTPIYYTTEGISQLTLRKAVAAALVLLQQNPPAELMPQPYLEDSCSLLDALLWIHNPPAQISAEQLQNGTFPAQKRLIMEELLAYQLSLRLAQQERYRCAYSCPYPSRLIDHFVTLLPYTLTAAQQRVHHEICADLQKKAPMLRLLQGDVGSGKTCVAAMAALQMLANEKQVVLMAPTEILAKQHYDTFNQWFAPLGIRVQYVFGGASNAQKKILQQELASQKRVLVIGTHALFYDALHFDKLGLVIIDEQHRFGVVQRFALWQKGTTDHHFAHQLILTATPIPRTLAMTFYANMAVSTLDELPTGRIPVTTVAMPNSKRDLILERIRMSAATGKQMYWVCTLIEESEHLQAEAAQALAAVLQQKLHPYQVGLIHGRMKATEKEAIMASFKRAELQLLVATTVIEVGVDVSNASIMVIENSERLGLAQLHQLRGRVGRSSTASHCILLYQAPLSRTAAARLEVMRATTDGFIIAQRDLEIRGFGEIVGTKQRGLADFKIVDLRRDHVLIQYISELASYFLTSAPQEAQILVDCWLADKHKYTRA